MGTVAYLPKLIFPCLPHCMTFQMPEGVSGVMVVKTDPLSGAHGAVKVNDVVLEVDGTSIADDGEGTWWGRVGWDKGFYACMGWEAGCMDTGCKGGRRAGHGRGVGV